MVIIVTVSVALVIGLNYKTVLASHKIKEVVDAVVPVEGIEIPDNVQIVGLGEASHGSKEFQESKLEMLKMLVEKKDYRAIVVEADFGDCLAANAYVQGGDGDSREIVNNMSFTIYHTKEMADILDWMKQYNASAPEDKKLRFYGFDMQNPEQGIQFLLDYIAKSTITGADLSATSSIIDENRTEPLSDDQRNKVKSEMAELKSAIEGVAGSERDFDTICALKITDNVCTAMDYGMQDTQEMNNFRDAAMAENVSWILDLEKEIGSGKIMLAGHDGHIAKKGQSAFMKVTMGGVLKEKYGDAYYSLGTDFFRGKSNIRVYLGGPGEYKRKDYFVTTADPIAYQAKYVDGKRFFLDFGSLSPENNAKLHSIVNSKVSMGSLGEGFSGIYYLMHSSYRVEMAPTDLYDGMIFYYEVGAIDPQY